MSTEPDSFACPNCGTGLSATGDKARCPTCSERFTLLYRQNCPGCGLAITGSAPCTRCPDCDENLPPAQLGWQYADQGGHCPACQRKLSLYEAGTRQCAHCGFTRSFNRSTGCWEDAMRPLLCSCGQLITTRHSNVDCPACSRHFKLNTLSGQWEEEIIYTDFPCPTCGQHHAVSQRAQQVACARCGLSYSIRNIQTCPTCHRSFAGIERSLCPHCSSALGDARPTWACDTKAGDCPICNNPMERTLDGGRISCPICKYIYAFDRASEQWQHHYRQLRCVCGTILTQNQRRTRCPGCNRRYRFNTQAGKWEEYEAKLPEPEKRSSPPPGTAKRSTRPAPTRPRTRAEKRPLPIPTTPLPQPRKSKEGVTNLFIWLFAILFCLLKACSDM